MLSKDPYDILGIQPGATDDQVRSAYRELAKKYHPDLHVDNPLAELAQDKFREVQEAYDTIMRERASGIPHNYNRQNQYTNQQPNGWPFGGGYNNQDFQEQYDRRSQQYGGTNGGSDPCSCCMQLWCLDSICECMGGDLFRCC